MVMDADFHLYTWGVGSYGALGHGDRQTLTIPTHLIIHANGKNQKVKQIQAGNLHSLIISAENHVFSWGTGSKGRLGHDNEDIDVLKPMLIQTLSSQKIESISAGESHSAAITNTHKLWTWGNNTYGRLGLGSDGSETKQVSVPTHVTFFEG